MTDIKKVNLKAQKITHVTHYNAKGQFVISKWEDTDPTKVEEERIKLNTHLDIGCKSRTNFR